MDEYRELLASAKNRRQELTEKRNGLMKEVEEINRMLLGINQAIEGFEFILKENSPTRSDLSLDPATIGFTVAVRGIFNTNLRPLYPTDVRDKLASAGYEKTSGKALLIHVHNVIDRLLKNEEIEEVRIEGKSAYRSTGKKVIPSAASMQRGIAALGIPRKT
jgi:hypothetical protein